MDRNQVLKKILEFFKQKGIEIEKASNVENIRYLDQGLLDSFDLIDFITYLEQEFNVELTPEDLQTDDFRSIGGIVDVILKRLN